MRSKNVEDAVRKLRRLYRASYKVHSEPKKCLRWSKVNENETNVVLKYLTCLLK